MTTRRQSVTALAAIGLAALHMVRSASAAEQPLPDVYRVGAYYGDDSSYAFTLNGDWAVLDASRVNLGGAYVNAKGETTDLNSYQLQTGYEYAPGAWSVGVEGEYRNDESSGVALNSEDTIETLTARLRGAYQGEQGRASVAIGRRKVELSLELPEVLQRYVDTQRETYSTEYALNLRFSFGAFATYANGRYFEYDDPIQSLVGRSDDPRVPVVGRPILQQRLEQLRERLNRLDFATVRLANNFLDYTVTVGFDYTLEEQSLNLEMFRERVTGDGTTIDGVEVGWVLPVSPASDLEVRLGGVHASSEWLPYGSLTFSFYR